MLDNSIAFVGDIHLQFSNPSSRIDNYFETIIGKMRQIMNKNKYFLSLGDLFSFPVLDIQGTMILVELLREYKEKGGVFIELMGNHTVYNWQLNTINKTTLGLLDKLKLLKILDRSGQIKTALNELNVGDWKIIPALLNNPKDLLPAPQEKSIMVAHSYYAFGRDKTHSLEYKDLKDLDYKYYFFGHEHLDYKPKIIEQSILYRPGALSRGTAEAYNFDRKIYYYRLNLDTDKIESVDIDYAPAEEVFSIQAVDKHNDSTPKYVYDLEALMSSFKQKKTMNISIKKMMEDNPEIPNNIVNFIESCYEACNIEFV